LRITYSIPASLRKGILGIYQQIKTIEGNEHGQRGVPLLLGMRKEKENGREKRLKGKLRQENS
jgi:hypothetical protein